MFRYRPTKVKFLTKVNTLDETHQKYLLEFENQINQLPNKKIEYENMLDELKKLQSIDKEELTPEIIKRIALLKDRVNDLSNEIATIENNEIDYYSKISDVLLDYYDIADTTTNISNTASSDTLAYLNEISQKDRKRRKPSKKRIKSMDDLQHRKTIFDYLNKSKMTDNRVINRATLFNEYKNIIDGKYGKKSFVKICPTCNIEKILIHSEGIYVCPQCGESESLIIESELTSYKDIGCEKPAYPYKRINHLIECLNQFQAKESIDIPQDVYLKILNEIKKNKYQQTDLTFQKMKTVLKKLKLHQFYEHIPHIISKITGKSAPIISRDIEEKIKIMFREIQEPFIKYCPSDRKNFLSYSYILHKFFQILKMDEFITYFSLLKSREKLRIQDQIWKKICDDLGYPFIPSV